MKLTAMTEAGCASRTNIRTLSFQASVAHWDMITAIIIVAMEISWSVTTMTKTISLAGDTDAWVVVGTEDDLDMEEDMGMEALMEEKWNMASVVMRRIMIFD